MTMTELLSRAAEKGVTVFLDGDQVAFEGVQSEIDILLPELREHKSEIIRFLKEDGRTPKDWLAMIRKLDALIGEYCRRFRLSDEDMQDIIQSRMKQPLETIPDCLAWFRRELEM